MFDKRPLAITQIDVDNLDGKITDVETAIDTLNTLAIGLTKDERRSGVTIGQKRKPFNDYYYDNKNSYPNLKPSQTIITEADAEKHYFIFQKFIALAGRLDTLKEKFLDIQLNSEHFAHDYASEGRLAAKRGKENGLPGADSFFDALDDLYPDTGRKPEVPEPA